jgi:hypothetical protein
LERVKQQQKEREKMFKLMKDVLRRSSRRRLVWFSGALILIAAGLTVSARTWLAPRQVVVRSTAAAAPMQGSSAPQAEEHGLIRLLTSGFSQPEVAGTAGQYRVVMTRVSKDEEVRLQLKSAGGETLQEIVMPPERADWTTLINLETGSYSLTVSNHPQWVCQLTVQ